jgi:hypothetical protein
MSDKLKEDTVSADRKERIIFDPDAWRKSDKSGRKTSAITSRQNFDNEKFTRKASKEEQVDEGTIQPSGDSKVDSAGPTQSDTISQDKKVKKSNSPQIEFVTGTATPNGSSSTAIGNQPMTGRKLAEALIEKAIKQVKGDSDWDDKNPPFDPDTTAEKEFKKPHNPNRSPMDTVRALAQKSIKKQQQNEACKDDKKKNKQISEDQYAGLEKEDKPGKKATEFKGSKGSVTGKTVEGWKDEKAPVKEGWDPEQFGSDGSGAGRPGGAGAGDIGKTDKKKKSVKLKQEETTMSKTYAQFMEQLLEYTPGPGGVTRVQGRSYGAQYNDPEGADDAWEKEGKAKPAAAAPAEKRGRGRPSGSYGTYKARSAETKAAAAAKSAATKAANKAK